MSLVTDIEVAKPHTTAPPALGGPPLDDSGCVIQAGGKRDAHSRVDIATDSGRSIVVRLGLSFALLIASMLVLGWWVSSRTERADLDLQSTVQGRPEKLRLAYEAMRLSSENTRITLQVLSQERPDPDLLASRLQHTAKIGDNIAELDKQCDSSEESDLLAVVKKTRLRYLGIRERAVNLLLRQHNRSEAYKLMVEQAIPELSVYHAAWEEFASFELRAMKRAGEENNARKRATGRIGGTVQSLSALFAGFIAVFTTRELARNLALRARMQRKLAALNTHLEQRVAERTEELALAEQQLRDSLVRVREYAAEIEAVNELTKLLQSCLTMAEAREQAGRVLEKFFSAGSVLLLNSSRNLLEVAVQWGPASTGPGPFPPESCWALRKGQVHLAGPHCTDPVCGHFDQQPAGCHLCIPMNAQGSALGTLSIDDPQFCEGNRKSRTFSRKLKLASTLGEQISLAFANLMLRETLKYQSVRDPLTGLFNRRHMEEDLNRELRRAARNANPLTVLMIDIDHFKQFNDSYGHEAGDLVLREFGLLLRLQVRGADIACRYGGEEFL
jgi:GAF domain-containing protein